MKSLNRVLTYSIMLLVILSISCGKDKKSPTGPDSKQDKIAFTSNRVDSFEIYIMDADGSNQTRLTDNSDEDLEAAWSPF